ncbi:MAG: Smr/MutS family protein [Acidobacteriota bacterium]
MSLIERLRQLWRRPETEQIEDQDAGDPFPDPVILEIKDVLDLHSVQPREVRLVVEEYLFQANLQEMRFLRIIHGKGIGVQREIVRGILARSDFVASFQDAPPEAGGLGATLVELASNTSGSPNS